MSNIIDSIKLSGTVYTLSAQTSGGGNPTVELTQAEYDALVSAGTVANDTYYIITDAQAGDLTQYWTSAQTQSAINQATSGKASQSDLEAVSGSVANKQDTLVSGTNIKTINNESILGSGNIDIQGGGGGKAIEAGRGISITTGATADTVSFNLPISAGTGSNSIIEGYYLNKASGSYSHAEGQGTSATSLYSHSEGYYSKANGNSSHAEGVYTECKSSASHAEGQYTKAWGSYSHSEGYYTTANTESSHVSGRYTKTTNRSEYASGEYNESISGSSTFGDSGNTLFSVGNGTADNARHNAFEIRQNGDIYLSSGGTDIKLQDHLGGGGGITSGEVQTMIDESVSGKADTSAVTAVQDSLSGYVTTNTDQDISGIKTFVGEKKIKFKQSSDSDKLGFTLYSSVSTNNELGAFELRPNTVTVDGVNHPLIYIGHYRASNSSSSMPQTMVGFRQYDHYGSAAYHYLIPLPEKAKTPFSLTTSFKNYYAPIGFKNGSTMITADETGVADLSSELGGLSLVKLTQSEYDNLQIKDENTLYIIV